MLERAADENSFSSQNSLVMQVLTSGHPLTLEPQLPKPHPSTSHPRSGTESPLTRVTTGREHPSEMKTVHQSKRTGCISNQGDIQSTPGIRNRNCDPISPPVCNSPPLSDSSCEEDLDETLKPSLATGVEFNDEEAWESFNQGSPLAGRGQQSVSSGSVTPDGSVLGAPWSSPVKRERLDHQGRTVFSSPLPTATFYGSTAAEHAANDLSRGIRPSRSAETNDKILTAGRESLSSASLQQNPSLSSSSATLLQSWSTTAETKPPDRPTKSSLAHLPPPSALVSKLFPALRKEREESKKQALQQLHVTTTATPGSSSLLRSLSTTSQDSGRDSGRSSTPSPPSSSSSVPVAMNEELRQKLCQLETEIERFRAENANLEKLRFQKEQVSMN